MMRLRRALVIAALPLLTWSATAYAECAWVLWLNPEADVGVRALLRYLVPWGASKGPSNDLLLFDGVFTVEFKGHVPADKVARPARVRGTGHGHED